MNNDEQTNWKGGDWYCPVCDSKQWDPLHIQETTCRNGHHVWLTFDFESETVTAFRPKNALDLDPQECP